MIEHVRELVADVLGLPLDAIGADTPRDEVERWDSMQNLNVAIALEQEFGVGFDPEDFERMTSVRALAELVGAKQARP